jgi:hypothetical protein
VAARTRVRVAALPALLVGMLALGGCSADFWAGRVPATEPSPTVPGVEDTQIDPPVIGEGQAERIVADLVGIAAEADAALDPVLAATRLAGPALALRTANYAARAADPSITAVDAIPDGDVVAVLPEQSVLWPRTAFVIIDDPTLTADGLERPEVAVMLVQESARTNYHAEYVVRLEPGAVIPDVAPPEVGATGLLPDSKFLTIAPGEISAAYTDILQIDSASAYNELFEAEGDSLRIAAGLPFKNARLEEFRKFGTSTDSFSAAEATGPVLALATIDGGAIVAVDANETETARPTEAGATVNAPKDVKALTGTASSGKGFVATYSYQLLFVVPSATEGGTASLVGYSTGITAASELP